MKLVTLYKLNLNKKEIENLKEVSHMCKSFPSNEFAKLPEYVQRALNDIHLGIDTLLDEMIEV